MNIFLQINHLVSQNLNSFVLDNHLEKIIGFLSDAPIFFLPIFLVGAWIFWTYKISLSGILTLKSKGKGLQNIDSNNKKTDLINIVYGIILAIIINLTIQHFFFFERPETLIKPILAHIPDASFPSDHAAVSIAFLTGLFLSGYRKIAYLFLVFAVLMNFSRIAGGVHWFFDIIAGAIIGIVSEIIIFRNKKYFEKLNSFIVKVMNYIKL